MNTTLEQMLKAYDVESQYDRQNAMKEIVQEIVLCGLSRAGFFKKAAEFCLRIVPMCLCCEASDPMPV